jgi:CHAT domain-containing protein
MKYFSCKFCLRVVILPLLFFSIGAVAASNDALLQPGQAFFQRGDFVQAIDSWETARQNPELSTSQQLELLINLAVAYQQVGQVATAHQLLEQAQPLADHHGTPTQQVLVRSQLGDVLLALQQADSAETLLQETLPLARTLNDPAVLAHLLTNLGNVSYILEKYPDALTVYTQVIDLAHRTGDKILSLQALNNQALVLLKTGQPQASLALLETAIAEVQTLPDNYDKGFQLLEIGRLALRLEKSQPTVHLQAFHLFQKALQLAKLLQNQRLLTYANGFLGQVYEQEQRFPEAVQLTRQAIFLAQEFPEIIYLWEWQLARLLQAQHDLAGAIVAYQRAIEHLHPIRSDLFAGQRDTLAVFNDQIRPVYVGLADMLLQQAALTSAVKTKTALLRQARESIERMKLIELQEYFHDECIAKVQAEASDLERQLDKHTAILYPISLPTRLELVLTVSDGISQFVVPVEYETLTKTLFDFRLNLQTSTSSGFITQAQQLYEWLIKPLQAELKDHAIKILVIVPDGPLRTVPLAALYDATAKQFLIHQVALATTPGLTLTAPRPLPRQNILVSLNGLSESVQNFPSLPNVPEEIKSINTQFDRTTTLLDKEYSLNHFRETLKLAPYEIVHIASHGNFDRNPNKTFILTYDDKLTMDRLQKLLSLSQMRKQPVELLTLSACQTAVGDERAALGLAGVALKAGVRSALASLWFVSDESTSLLITEFYRNLMQHPELSKAEALQQAQQHLISTEAFRHPLYWAPFLLIGNWL